jgi:acyl-CoA synthetase (NDP forming)
MQRLFGSIAAFFVGLVVSTGTPAGIPVSIDVEQAKSDAAGLVAYAALAKAPTPTPTPEPAQVKAQQTAQATEHPESAAAEAQITASTGTPAVVPLFIACADCCSADRCRSRSPDVCASADDALLRAR